MGFKPMTKYFTAFEISKTKAYKILKERACGISMQKAYNILAFMGLIENPQTATQNSFHQISKEKALQIHDLMGFKPITKYFPASDISKKKA